MIDAAQALWAAPFVKLIIFLVVGTLIVDWRINRNES